MLFGGPVGQHEMLRATALHLTIAGECYLVGRTVSPRSPSTANPRRVGDRRPSTEMHAPAGSGASSTATRSRSTLTDADVVIRVWLPAPPQTHRSRLPVPRHAARSSPRSSDSPGTCSPRSPPGSPAPGILLLPQGITFPTPDVPEGGTPPANDAEALLSVLGEAILTPIKDQASPSAVVPIIGLVPEEALGKSQHIKFWTELDDAAIELRTEAIRRLALGLDMPPEVLLGTSDVNHWSAWQIDESSIKAHIEPLLQLITSAITEGYLYPITEQRSDVVAADTAELRLRPNRSKEALELFDRGELSGPALRRETGFDGSDAPDEESMRGWLLKKVAGGSATPEMVAAALALLGVELAPVGDTMREERPSPSLEDHPELEPPEEPDQERPEPEPALASSAERNPGALEAVCGVVVQRALERAGNRMCTRTEKHGYGCKAHEVYLHHKPDPVRYDHYLADAWEWVPQIAAEYRRDTLELTQSLDSYCRALLQAQTPHDPLMLASYLGLQEAAS